jgi:hypothetical protein
VAAALALCPRDEWISVDDLFAAMRRSNLSPTIARSERGLWRLYLGDPEYGSLGYDGFHDWPILEGRYTLAVLFEYAATLGLLDVDYVSPAHARDDFRHMWGADGIDALSRYDGLRAVRLTPLGAYAGGFTTTYVPAAPASPDRTLQVLANHDIVATADLAPADRLALDAFAARTSDRVWTVSTASLRRRSTRAGTRRARELPERPTGARGSGDGPEATRRCRGPRRAGPRPRHPPRPQVRRRRHRHAAHPGPLDARVVHTSG